jgi:probable DNA metabolism protein
MSEVVRLVSLNDFAEWRAVARALLIRGVPPADVEWHDPAQAADLLSATAYSPLQPIMERHVGRVPMHFIKHAQAAICHSDAGRFALLYSLLWRLQKDRRLLFNLDDTDVGKLRRRVQAVLADCKNMREQLRFRRAVAADGHKGLAASFTPAHYVLERIAPHFTTTIADEDWVITTPYRSAFWDRRELTYGPGRLGPLRRG